MSSDTLEYTVIDAPESPAEDTPQEPLRLTPELLEKFSQQSMKIQQIRQMVERARRTEQHLVRRQKQKARNRVKGAMSKASRKRNRGA